MTTIILTLLGIVWLIAVIFFGERMIPTRALGSHNYSLAILRVLRGSVWILALVWCVFSLRERSGMIASEESYETIFVLDISYSMLAEDITPNRLERIKGLIKTIVEQAPKNERFGVVLFAGKPFVLSYPSRDTSNLTSLVREISTESIDQSDPQYAGTNIGDGLLLAESLFDSEMKSPRIILFTDGEGNKGSEVGSVGEFLKRWWINLTSVGVGSTEGIELITTDRFGNKRQFVENGVNIITRLDSTLLTTLTTSASGSFIGVMNNEQIARLEQDLTQQYLARELPPPPERDTRPLLLIALSEWLFMCALFLWYRLWKRS